MATLERYRITNYDGTNVTARGVFDDIRYHAAGKTFLEFTLNVGVVESVDALKQRVINYFIDLASGKKQELARTQVTAEISAIIDQDQTVNITI